MLQHESSAEVFSKLEVNSGRKMKHDLAKLSSFVDSHNIIDLKCQLSTAKKSDDLKLPILLSTEHLAVVVILKKRCEYNLHEEADYMRSLVQQRFLAVGQRNAMQSIKSKFFRCRKLAVQPLHLHMTHLPKERVEGSVYPVRKAGVDYFGLFEVTLLRRPLKHWCSWFTCLVTRAVHIEGLIGLDTIACKMAITRF